MTDYSKNIFGKSLDMLTFSDVQDYFLKEREESNILEFKSFSARAELGSSLNAVKECITGFLNSQGGILIWGAPAAEKKEGQKEKVFKGSLTPLEHIYSKDELINEVSFPIQPLPIGIQVKILKSEFDTNVYVFEVQESIYKPHQFKHVYQIRLDGQTVKAPHYIVEALMRRVSYPNIQGYLKFDNAQLQGDNILLSLSVIFFNMSPLQNEENISFTLSCAQGIFPKSKHPVNNKRNYQKNGMELVYNNFIDVLHFGTPNEYQEIFEITNISDDKMIMALTFGGKNSPRKWCRYVLNMSNFRLSDPQFNVIEIEENILFADSIEKLGEQMIKDYLGR